MKNFLKVFTINILLLFFFIFAVEVVIWTHENFKMRKDGIFPAGMEYIKFHKGIRNDHIRLYRLAKEIDNWGRGLTGANYTSRPVVIFGCSYAYGYNLEPNQTFSYKLSELTKRPVYNQAFTGWGIQHMLYQSKIYALYKKIQNPEYVIYVYIPDHLRRLYLLSFSSWNVLSEGFNIRYKNIDGKLEEIRNNNKFLNQFKRLYFINFIQNKIASKYAKSPKNREKVFNFALQHFVESKNEMQKYWKDAKYVILFYDDYYESSKFKSDLEKEGFTIIDTKDLTNENLKSEKYMQPSIHPTEAAWDLLTPLIAERLNI